MTINRLNLSFIALTLLAFGAFGLISGLGFNRVMAAGVGATCTYDTACDSGLICTGTVLASGTCQQLSISINLPETRADRIFSYLYTSSHPTNLISPPQLMNFYGCIGTAAVCQSQPVTNTAFWTSFGAATNTLPWFQYTGLRPGRSYTLNMQAVQNGSVANATQSGLVTWPGFGFTPTETPGTCDGGTGLCTRNISWTTPFPGDSKVIYGTNPPGWILESNPRNTSSNVAGLIATANGHVWGVGFGGQIIHRDPSGTWAPQTSPTTNMLYAVSSADGVRVWAVGQNGNVISSGNSGASWSTPQTIYSGGNLLDVNATSATTAWATGRNNVYFFDGTTWRLKLTDAVASFQSVTSISNTEAWAVSNSGIIRHSTNTSSDWGSATPPVWQTTITSSTDQLTTISTLNGTILWAGGFNSITGRAVLYRSIDGGNSWTPITAVQSSLSRIENITQIDDDTFWCTSGSAVTKFEYNNGSPIISSDSQPGIQLGSTVFGLAIDASGNILAGGEQQNISRYGLPTGSTPYTVPDVVSNHNILISGLAPATTYYYSAESTGSGVTSGAFGGSFTTPTLDTIKPTVAINPIVPQYRNTCAVTVTGTAADTAPGSVLSVTVAVDGNAPIAATGTTNWTVAIPCAQVSVGSHTLTAISNDGTNNSNPSTTTFTYDNNFPTVTITAASPTTTSPITVSGTASDNDQVAKIEIVNGSSGRIPVTITPSASLSWSYPNLALTPGLNHLSVYATDRAGNETLAVRDVTYNVPTFTLTPDAPTSQMISAGATATFPIKATAVDGFTGTIAYTASVSPSGLSPLFSAPGTALTSTITSIYTSLIVPTPAGGASGPYTITVTGTSGAIIKTTQVTLNLTATPDFSLSVAPSSNTVVAGNSAVYVLTVAGTSTYAMPAGGIDWSTSVLPSGVTDTFAAMTGNPSSGGTASVRLTLATATTTVNGTYSITLSATDGSITKPITISLTVTPAPDFSLTMAPASSATTAGSGNPGSYNINVASLNGFSGNVRLQFGSPAIDPALHPVLSQTDVAIAPATPASVTVNVTADSAIACTPPGPCNYTLTLTGSSNTTPVITKTTTVTLAVTPDTTAPIISGQSANASDHDVSISWTTNEPANSRIDLYADAARTNHIGFKDSVSVYCLVDCHAQTYGSILSPVTTYYYTITSVDQAYPSGNSATLTSDANGPLQFTTQAAPDNTPPTITISSPAAGSTVMGSTTISGTASDNSDMSQITLAMTGPLGAVSLPTSTIGCSTGTTCPFSISWNTLGGSTPKGSYTLTATARSSAGPAFTATASVSFFVDVPTAPSITCLPGQTTCEPQATVTCNAGVCSALIHWITDKDATSEVEYGLSVDCGQNVNRADGLAIPCAYTNAVRIDDKEKTTNPNGSVAQQTDHTVTLPNLDPNKLYHYRVTSCTVYNLCTN